MDIGEGTVDDPDLLMGIMEAREAVEMTQSDEELRKFAATFQQQADDCIEVHSIEITHETPHRLWNFPK